MASAVGSKSSTSVVMTSSALARCCWAMAEPVILEDPEVPLGTPRKLLLLEAGSHFEGMLVALRPARIEGCLRGALRAVSSLEIGPQAVVEGELDVGSLLVAGRVRGVIRARSTVELAASAVVEGRSTHPES